MEPQSSIWSRTRPFGGSGRCGSNGGEPDQPCLIFLDAELYVDRVCAPEIVQGMIHAHELPQVTCVYLSYGEPLDRHLDFACNEEFTSFLADVFCPWVNELTGRHNEFVLCGLSLSGLAAAFAALRYPKVFPRTLCQSPSAWWNDDWLQTQFRSIDLSRSKCWMSVGDRETDENVTHGPTGMLQKASQWSSVRLLVQAMNATSVTVHENLFLGGHEPSCWASELPSALQWLLAAG